MNKEELKQKFLERVEKNSVIEFKKEHLTILDECVENVLKMEATFNNRMPQNDDEYFITIGYSLISAIQAYESLIRGVLKSQGKCVVNVNYRGETFHYSN